MSSGDDVKLSDKVELITLNCSKKCTFGAKHYSDQSEASDRHAASSEATRLSLVAATKWMQFGYAVPTKISCGLSTGGGGMILVSNASESLV